MQLPTPASAPCALGQTPQEYAIQPQGGVGIDVLEGPGNEFYIAVVDLVVRQPLHEDTAWPQRPFTDYTPVSSNGTESYAT